MFNSHVHMKFSRDCSAEGSEMCEKALSDGLLGIAFTDHCFLDACITENSYKRALESAEEAMRLRDIYKGRLKISVGTEMGEALRKPDYADRIINAAPFDIVLMSVHKIIYQNMPNSLSRIDFQTLSDDEISDIIMEYFREVEESVLYTDFDVCAHLTLPFRYISGVYKRKIRESCYEKPIKKILSLLIKHEKALELNTGDLKRQICDFIPDEKIIKLYYEMGGRLITIGSDAHVPENIATGLSEGISLLKKCGFSEYCYYEKRNPVMIPIN